MPLMKEQKLRGYITCPRESVNNKGIQNQFLVYILGSLYHSMCFSSKRNFIFFSWLQSMGLTDPDSFLLLENIQELVTGEVQSSFWISWVSSFAVEA